MRLFLNYRFFMLFALINYVYFDNKTKYLLNRLVNNTGLPNKSIYLSPNGKLKTLEYQEQKILHMFIN